MIAHILERHSSLTNHPLFTPSQLGMDEISASFTKEVSNPLGLAAMVGGSFTYRLSELALGRAFAPFMANSGIFTRSVTTGSIKFFSLAAEVSTFRSITQGPKRIFSSKEWQTDFLNFGIMKSVGCFSRDLNPFLNHPLQAASMVLGNHLAYKLDLSNQAEGNIFQQLLHAETSILQMNSGISLFHSLTGNRISILEKSIDLEIHSNRAQEIFHSRPLKNRLLFSSTHGDTVVKEGKLRVDKGEMTREEKIIKRNGIILHDIRNKLAAPMMHASILMREYADLSPEHPLKLDLQTLTNRLQQASSTIESTRQKKKTAETPDSSEAIAEAAQADTDMTRLNISDLVNRFTSINLQYLKAGNMFDNDPVLKDRKYFNSFQKLGPLLQKLEIFTREKLKEIEEASLPSLVSLAAVLQEAWHFSEAERRLSNIQTEPDYPPHDILIHINQYTLMASVLNLLVNACHAMRASDQRQLYLHGHTLNIDEKDYIIIEVRDTGSGIHEDHKADIFKPHFTTKPRGDVAHTVEISEPLGTGMGLYMVSEMIRQYGGRIELNTVYGKGSTFSIYLPSFDPSIGIEERILAERGIPNDAQGVGRRYPQINLEAEETEWRKMFGEVVKLDLDEPLRDSFSRGKTLAKIARTILLQDPYPDCQRALLKVHRMLELAYVRLDFEMLRAYRENVDPEVNRYISILIHQTRTKTEAKDHFYTNDEMPLDLPGSYVVPSSDNLRISLTTQFSNAPSLRTVPESANLFREESVEALASAFVNTFKNKIGGLKLFLDLMKRLKPELSISDLLAENFEDARSQKYREILQRALLETGEYRRIFLTNHGDYSQRFISLVFDSPNYNLREEYKILMNVLRQIPEEQRIALGIEMLPSENKIASALAVSPAPEPSPE